MKTYTYGMGSFDWSLNIHVWNLSRNFWYAYHFIHETFDTRIVLYTKLLIRVCFLTWNFSYVEPLALFVHFGQPYVSVECMYLGLSLPLPVVWKRLQWELMVFRCTPNRTATWRWGVPAWIIPMARWRASVPKRGMLSARTDNNHLMNTLTVILDRTYYRRNKCNRGYP